MHSYALFLLIFSIQVTTHGKLLRQAELTTIAREIGLTHEECSLLHLQKYETEQQFSDEIRFVTLFDF